MMGRLKGFFTGGLLGLIAGVLVAPKKGEETRQELKVEGEKLSTKAQEISKTAKEKYEEVIAQAKKIFGAK